MLFRDGLTLSAAKGQLFSLTSRTVTVNFIGRLSQSRFTGIPAAAFLTESEPCNLECRDQSLCLLFNTQATLEERES